MQVYEQQPLNFCHVQNKTQQQNPLSELCTTMVCLCCMDFRSEFGIKSQVGKGLLTEIKAN